MAFETIPGKIISFLSDHFELIITINGAIFLSIVGVWILVKLRDPAFLTALYAVSKKALYFIFVATQVFLFVLYGSLYWRNYKKPAPVLRLDQHVLADTKWVRDNARIYFIDENKLRSIQVNNRDLQDVFEGADPVKEYHFSPDGKHILVLTLKDLVLVDRRTKQKQHIDTLGQNRDGQEQREGEAVKGSIGGIHWAPDSQKFIYEKALWSKFSSQDNVFIYDVAWKKPRMIRSPTRRISSLYWDKQGENLYYLHHEAKDPSDHVAAYEVMVYRIPLETLITKMVARIPFEDDSVPIENLRLRNIDLYLEGDQFSFGIPVKESDLVSDKGAIIGIDDDDCLYFVSSKWFRKRLYKIPRDSRVTDIPRHQYQGGDLVISDIRWILKGRYVIMEHRYWGILILEPTSGKIGLLIRANGHTFGWYQKPA